MCGAYYVLIALRTHNPLSSPLDPVAIDMQELKAYIWLEKTTNEVVVLRK